MQTIDATFVTFHTSGNDVHLRTDNGIIFISKDKKELQEEARKLRRGQKIRVVGELERSKVLSTQVIAADKIEALG